MKTSTRFVKAAILNTCVALVLCFLCEALALYVFKTADASHGWIWPMFFINFVVSWIIATILGMIPGIGNKLRDVEIDERQFDRIQAIILSMTPAEREKPSIINPSRKRRIAAGSGMKVEDVNRLLKQYDMMRQMMKQMSGGGKATKSTKKGKKGKRMMLPGLGGPGFPGMGGPGGGGFATRTLFDPLEEHFTVVSWDEPGTGKSYGAVGVDELTRERFVVDAVALTDLLRERFGQERIFLYGVSWTSILGIWLVDEHPELYHALVTSGQMVNTTENDELGYALALEHVRALGDTATVATLEANGPPPYTGTDVVFRYLAYLDVLNDIMGAPRYAVVVPIVPFLAPEYGLVDKVNHTRGLIDSFNAFYPKLADLDLAAQVPRVEVPVWFFVGRADVNAMASLVEDYHAGLDAPRKDSSGWRAATGSAARTSTSSSSSWSPRCGRPAGPEVPGSHRRTVVDAPGLSRVGAQDRGARRSRRRVGQGRSRRPGVHAHPGARKPHRRVRQGRSRRPGVHARPGARKPHT
jgi:pimeloyl-ACP methyl ester carboxylesterase